MTLRISRDSGNSYGPVVVHDAERDSLLPIAPEHWPVCTCRWCTRYPGSAYLHHGLARLMVDFAMEDAGVPEKLWEGGS